MSNRTKDSITTRHRRRCPAYRDRNAACRCTPTYQAQVGSGKDRVSRSFPTYAAAKGWRDDARSALRRGTLVTGKAPPLREAGKECVELMRAGVLRTRSGDPYKPSTIRAYDDALRLRLNPEMGAMRLSEIQSKHLQKLIERWQVDGLDPSTIRNTLMPLRVVYRRALRLGDVAVNPTANLDLPAVRGQRERIATAQEAAILIGLVPVEDQAIWATAFYAGPRRAELMALDWERDVDLKANIFRITEGWDVVEQGEVGVKSRAGKRTLPIIKRLRPILLEHAVRTGRRKGLVFGRDAEHPFTPTWIQKRADRAWAAAEERRREQIDAGVLDPETSAPIRRITLHECRHTFASLMIAAQVRGGAFNPKVLQTLMGHQSIQITYDRYGHLFPGSETAAGEALERYLEAADGS